MEDEEPRFRFGIGARLWTAFLTITLLSGVVAGIAFHSYGQATTTLAVITQKRLPGILAIARLAEDSNGLLTALPNALLVRDANTLADRWREVALAEGRLHDAVRVVASLPDADNWFGGFSELSGRISAILQVILSALQANQEAQRLVAAESVQLGILQQEYRLMLNEEAGLAPAEIRFLVMANEATSMLGESLVSPDLNRVTALNQRAHEVLERMRAAVPDLPAGPRREAAAGYCTRLGALVDGPAALGRQRALALKAATVATTQFDQVRTLADQFNARVQGMLAGIKVGVDADRLNAERQLRVSKMLITLAGTAGLLIAVLVAWLYVGRGIVGRLNRLSASMRRIAGGQLNTPIPMMGDDEIAGMARSLSVFRDAMARIDYLASNDPLTHLFNRHGFHAAAARLLADSGRRAFLYRVNLRRFKDVNQTFGYHTGDSLLAEVASRLRQVIRGEDIAARLGADDFALMTVDDLDTEAAWRVCEDIRDALSLPVVVGHVSVDLHPCIGFACWPADAPDLVSLERCAELAAQRAKDDTGNPIQRFELSMAEDMEASARVRQDLRAGIECGDLHLLYQPKVALRSGRLVGMEALVRWDHPRHGRISPDRFIPVAESSGLIIPLGEWVLRECCRQMQVWRAAGLTDLRVSINMSPVQVFSQDVASMVAAALVETDLPPEVLEVEITEGVFVHDEDRARQQLEGLRDMGIALSIDDFGTGYSALSYLKRLPVSILKIDQSFVREITTKPENARLCRAIIGVGHDFGLDVVAEGIETADHLAFLRSEGCDYGQGYHFAKPLEPDAFFELAKAQPWLIREVP
ncbi:GGDEF domain-containing protein [Pararhodospirillum oryzae]|uniref:GGDEF domain-containing protein n=2 Tax=Pararhodospirillum oryzae TaxID=478448 RepID=A0A512H3F0_9PROT|nr:GGDEF domain-containing protein [Pararhodospirillum oryzae]